jgi:hypothetical protein
VCVISGIARGCGWQHIGAYVNLGAFYLCGIPVAAALGFRTQLRGMGLWIGIQIGAFVQTILLCIITSCTNWKKQVSPALLSLDAFDLSLAQDVHLLLGCQDVWIKREEKLGLFDNHCNNQSQLQHLRWLNTLILACFCWVS